MASQQYYAQVWSSDKRLEIVKSITPHGCSGVAIERGNRPDLLQDVWMIGRSIYCQKRIPAGDYYVRNRIHPPYLNAYVPQIGNIWITCLKCAIQTYPEVFHGPLVYALMGPITPERKQQVVLGLEEMLQDVEEMTVEENEALPDNG